MKALIDNATGEVVAIVSGPDSFVNSFHRADTTDAPVDDSINQTGMHNLKRLELRGGKVHLRKPDQPKKEKGDANV